MSDVNPMFPWAEQLKEAMLRGGVDIGGMPVNDAMQAVVARIAFLTEQLEAARRNAREAEACLGEGWQPIETAPRDGTEIILGWDIASVWIIRSGWWEDGFDPIEGGYDEEDEGWWSYRHSVTQEKLDGYDNPTHWMPMPEPPKESP